MTSTAISSEGSQIRLGVDSGDPLPVLQLTNWPLRSSRGKCMLLAAVLIGLAIGIGWVSSSWELGLFAALIFGVVTWRIWLPVSFELDMRGIQQIFLHTRSFVPWKSVARFEADDSGVLLLNDVEEYPLCALRGLYIHGDDQQAELVHLVEYYFNRHREETAVTVIAQQER